MRRIEIGDVEEVLRTLVESPPVVVVGPAKHIYDLRACTFCDRRAVLRVGEDDLCSTHAFGGMSAKHRAALRVDRIGRKA